MTFYRLFELLIVGGAAASVVRLVEAILVECFRGKVTNLSKLKEHIDSIEEMLSILRRSEKAILQDRLKYLARCYIGRGTISIDDRRDLIQMAHIYKNDLDGNGHIASLVDLVLKLPLR